MTRTADSRALYIPRSQSSILRTVFVWLVFALLAGLAAPLQAAPRLKVSENKRFLVTDDNKPFFYLADTAWELFHRLDREQAERYLKNRAAKGYTAIQAVALAELDGLHDPNAYGQTPLLNDDPTKPNEDYFKHVDWIIAKADELNLYIALLPTWGDKVNKKWGVGPEIFNPENAKTYGAWLGKRYAKQSNIIWVLGGDRPVENETHRKVWDAMAAGLKEGDGGVHLMTFHPPGRQNSAKWFHDAPWLDFNMWQNGHCDAVPVWENLKQDYDRLPTKPTMDGEPLYEDHPLCFKPKEMGYSVAADVRRFAWWDVLSGACGHTYGNHSVWQMYDKPRKPVNGPLITWQEALDHPGAGQMRYVRDLVESRPYLTRISDPQLITSNPGAGLKRVVAARGSDGAYALVYSPAGRPFTIDLMRLSGEKIKAWWYSPRDGKATEIGLIERAGTQEFSPPDPGEMIDWVLVLDDASKGFGVPGKR